MEFAKRTKAYTLQPSVLTPWELQKEFYRAMRKFYTLRSSLGILRLFGLDSALRRMGIAVIVRLLLPGIFILSRIGSESYYYRLRKISAKIRRQDVFFYSQGNLAWKIHRRVCGFTKVLLGNGAFINRLEDKIHKEGHRKKA